MQISWKVLQGEIFVTFVAAQLRSVFLFCLCFCLFSEFLELCLRFNVHPQRFFFASLLSCRANWRGTWTNLSPGCSRRELLLKPVTQPTAAARTPLQRVGWRHWVFTNRQKLKSRNFSRKPNGTV